MQPTDLSIRDAGAALRAGRLTATDLAQAHLDLISRLNPSIGAFVAITPDLALAAAARADADFAAGIDRGPMQGIGFAVKDLIDLKGLPTTCGSRHHAADPAMVDATVIAGLLGVGAVPLGKVATYEYALVGPSLDSPQPPPVNPWNFAHITGGSSSGAAAAVAAGMVRVAIGTDTGGSIRSPACYCGVVGLKPTFGTVSRDGVFPVSGDLDHVGPLAATVADAALMADAMGIRGAATRLVQPVKGLRIGYARAWFANDPATHPAVLTAMDAAVSDLTLLGMKIELIDLPNYTQMESVGAVILHYQALAIHRCALLGGKYGRQAVQTLLAGLNISTADFQMARALGQRMRAQTSAILSRYDAVVTANVLSPAPPFSAFSDGRAVWTAMRTLPFNVTGHPVLALPIGFTAGLPMGMQLIASHGHEATLCQIGHAFERSTDHAAQRPRV